MDKLADKVSLAVFRTKDGFEVRGNILRLAPFVAGLEIYHPEIILQSSEVLSDFQILLGEQQIYNGRAVVTELVHTGPTLVCQVKLEHGFDPALFSALKDVTQLREQFQGFMQEWQRTYRILPNYKIVVADMQSFLAELRQWLEQIELSIRAAPSGDRVEIEQKVLGEIGKSIVPMVDGFFEKFEAVTPHIEPDMLAAHEAYMRRILHPLVLCSPFAYRTFSKPLGYAGDYEMVNMMMRNPFEGSSVFAKLLNLWFVEQPPAVAHRNRVTYLQKILRNETARTLRAGRTARILNLGCGPALEVQRFLAEDFLSDKARFDLLDFNSETLTHLKNVLEEVKRRHGRLTGLNYINRPVHQLLKYAGKTVERTPDQQYDLIYCAGLFDYLTDAVCQRLTTLLYSWLAPGGLLLTTNVDPSNPLRYGMEHLLGWHLIYRNSAGLRAVRPTQVAKEDAIVQAELTGVNLFLEIRKEGHA